MAVYQMHILGSNGTRTVPVTGGSFSVPAGAGQVFRLVDATTGKAPAGAHLVRKGLNLDVVINGETIATVDDFYAVADAGYQLEDGHVLASENLSGTDAASGSAEVSDVTENTGLSWGAELVGSEMFWPVVAGTALLGGAAIAKSGGGSSSADAVGPVAAVTVSPFAGPFISSVKVEIFDANGNLLGQGSVDSATGQVVINISNGYSGPVLVVVSDTNGTAADYISEATGEETSLNGSLRAMGTVDGNGTFNISVTPLTELATQLADVPADVSSLAANPLQATQVQNNQIVADLFGVDDILGEVVTVVDDDFNQADGVSAAEAYGDALALLSGMEQNLGGISNLVSQLAAEVTVASDGTASLSAAGNSLLQAGLDTFENGPNADLLDSGSAVTRAPVLAEASDGLSILEAADGTVLTVGGVAEGDRLVVTLGAARFTVDVTSAMLNGSEASVAIPLATLQAAGNGDLALLVSVNGVDRPAIEVVQDLTAPTVSIRVADTSLSAGESTRVTFTFSEAVTGFSSADVVLESGALSAVSSTDGGITWTAIYTPAADLEDAAVQISVNPGFTDRVGNQPGDQLDGSTSSAVVAQTSVVVDTLLPVLTSGTSVSVPENTVAGTVVYTATTNDSGATMTLAGADAASFSLDAVTGEVTLLARPDYESQASYEFSIIVTDTAGNQSVNAVTLAVTDVDEVAPVFTSGATASAIDENTGAGQVVYTAATDDPAASLTLGGVDAALFSLNAATGAVTLLANANHESREFYEFSITATDLVGNRSVQTVTLAVNDLDESAPTIISGDTAASVNENIAAGQLVYSVRAQDRADVDDATASPVTLSLAGVDAEHFSLDAATGAVTLNEVPDHEQQSSYSFDVVATDAAGNTATQTVTLAVNDLDDAAPVITSGSTAAAINENTAAGQLVYVATAQDAADVDDATASAVTLSLAGADAEHFSFDVTSGAVTLNDVPDHESRSSYQFDIVATDLAGNTTTQTVRLAVNDLDESAPVFTSANTATLAENAGAGRVVYTASAIDTADIDDSTVTSGGITYSLGEPRSELFSIDPQTGAVTLTTNPDHEAVASYSFVVVATDNAGNSASRTVTLDIVDLDESDPVFVSSAAVSVDENIGAGQVIYTAQATDTADIDDNTDTSSALTYSLAGSDAALLQINSDTGEVTLSVDPNHEVRSSYSFDVTATDEAGNTTTQTVALTINDLDEAAPDVVLEGYDRFDGYVVAWVSNFQDGSYAGVFAQRYQQNGEPVGGEFQVNTYTNNYQERPSITALPDGGFVVVWDSTTQENATPGIYGQRYNNAGAPVGDEFHVNSTIAGDQEAAVITALADGGFVVTWTSTNQDGALTGVYGQRFAANGDSSGEFRINTETDGRQQSPSVTALDDGGFVVVWISDNQDGSGFGIYGQQFGADGSATGSEFQVNTFTSGAQADPVVTALANGGFVVAWESALQDGSGNGVYAQVYGVDGMPEGAEFRVNTYTNSHQENPAIAALTGGGFVVVWESYGQDGSSDGIYGQLFDANGRALGNEFLVNQTYTSGDQTAPSVSALDGGGFVVTWTAVNYSGDEFDGVYSQRFDRDGNTVGDEIHVNTETDNRQNAAVVSGYADVLNAVGSIDENTGAGQLIFSANFRDEADIDDTTETTADLTYSLTGADAAYFRVDNQGNVYLLADANYEDRSRYQFEVVGTDSNHNQVSQSVELNVNDLDEPDTSVDPDTSIDTSVVIFDLVNGESSSHSGRSFDANTAYTIYIITDENSGDLASLGAGVWTNGAALGSDDQIVMIGDINGAQGEGLADGTWGGSLGMAAWRSRYSTVSSRNELVSNGTSFYWTMVQHTNTHMATVASLTANGNLNRDAADVSDHQALWTGQAGSYQAGFALSLPADLLTSQGLV